MAQQEPAEFALFVGDIAADVDDALLEHMFKTYYGSVTSAKVMIDQVTQRGRGFGFVRFSDEAERDRAIEEMHGVYIGSKPVRVSLAAARPPHAVTAARTPTTTAPSAHASPSGGPVMPAHTDPSNTTLFVGGLNPAITEAELHAAFASCGAGEIVYTKIPPGKGCGFVQFVQRQAAERALALMSGFVLGGAPIRVSWGKSARPAAAPPTAAVASSSSPVATGHPAASQAGGGGYGPAFAAGGQPFFSAGDPVAAWYQAAAAFGMYGALTGYMGGGMHDPTGNYMGYAYPMHMQGAAMPGPASSLASGAPGAVSRHMHDTSMASSGRYMRVPVPMPVQHM